MDLTSRYATIDGCHDKLGNYDIPQEWWSRKFEYPWASQFVIPTDVVVDAACGVTHFFKYWLADNCAQVTGIDMDPHLLEMRTHERLKLVVGDIAHMDIADASVDKLFCISVFEHITDANKRQDILVEFARVLRPDGLVLLTMDIPTISIERFLLDIAASKALKHAGEVQLERPNNILTGGVPSSPLTRQLNVFCSVLRKR